MTIKNLVNQWNTDPSIGSHFSAVHVYPKREPTFCDLPSDIDPRLQQALKKIGIRRLYLHQYKAFNAISKGKNLALVTGTSSGKSLGYILPIVNKLLSKSSARGLFLYPTKALAHDQLNLFEHFPSINAQAYDGDTPKSSRKWIRQNARIIITNPDMLHIGILPYHIEWMEFFKNLEFIVLDEIHIYRGVFGSHVANVIHRLRRIAEFYNSAPQFTLTSATIGNPKEFSQSLINSSVKLISDDCSSRGSKTFILYNPPVIDKKLGIRASLQGECIRLASDLIQRDFQTILFTRTRRNVEFLLSKLHSSFPEKTNKIKSYRSGYLSTQRRKIEKGLKDGSIRTVTTTNALELGIDIGGLDSAILAGYPGTIAGTLQQAGRSGRTTDDSLSILVASSSPLDQYLAQHPEYIFETNPENALINPENLLIALAHIECALYELPFDDGMRYGRFTPDQTRELLEVIKNKGKAYLNSSKYYWMAEDYPAKDISLRTASMDRLLLQVERSPNKHHNLGSIDKDSSYWMVHSGAIYLHEGESYLVKDLDFDNNLVLLSPTSLDYYTEAEKQTNFHLLNLIQSDHIPGGQKHYGDIKVTTQVTGYKKIKWNQYEVLSRETLDLPTTSLTTQGYWITISDHTEDQLRLKGNWSSSPNVYGSDWNSIRQVILSRDNYSCQMCGVQDSGSNLHIHHKIPIRNYNNIKEAHAPGNLISLCPRCHKKAELVVKINSGIRGISYALHALAPLFLMCDPSDLEVYYDFISPFGDSRPLALIFELVPAGIGFSKALYDQHDSLVAKALELVATCPCANGCPSCVGPGGEKGSGGKEEALALLQFLVS